MGVQFATRTTGSVILCLLVGLLLSPSIFAAQPVESVERALTQLEDGEIGAARIALNGVPADALPDALVPTARGIGCLLSRDMTGAESAFRTVLDQYPRQLPALWGLAICLLEKNRPLDAAALLDRAAAIDARDAQIKSLQAYTFMLLGRNADAAACGKVALEGGGRSPLLLAALAQTQRQLGYTRKAAEFGELAAKGFAEMDYLTNDPRIALPMVMQEQETVATHPVVGDIMPPLPASDGAAARPETSVLPQLKIVTPVNGALLAGPQRIQATLRGTGEIRFVTFLVDRALRLMTTELPYHFSWDADSVAAGEHQLTVRAYDFRGVLVSEDTIRISTVTEPTQQTDISRARLTAITQRLMTVSLPTPAPLAFFTRLGWWYYDAGDTPQAISAFEKALAIDPTNEHTFNTLTLLYRQNGLHLFAPTSQIYRGPETGKLRVALTFDDGPNPMFTPTILTELRRYDARATFFTVGKMARLHPDLVQQILADGHELANHTYTHPNVTKLSREEIIAEVLRARATIKDITRQQTYLFRPPGGNIDPYVVEQLRALDYNVVYWSINAMEYKNYAPDDQVARIVARVKSGSIILLHNGPVDGTLGILPSLLSALSRRGYSFVTVSDLMTK